MSSDRPVTTTASARALASRRNGAKSRGPKTAAGKARSARNALKHGLCSKQLLVLAEEDVAPFRALERALLAELAPVGVLQAVLAQRVVSAAWRLMRADRMEAEVLDFRRLDDGGGLGLALIRDGNGTRSVETVMRYRNAAMAELLRAQKTLHALQAPVRADARAAAGVAVSAPRQTVERKRGRSAEQTSDRASGEIRAPANSIEPDIARKPNEPKPLPQPRPGRSAVPAPALPASASFRDAPGSGVPHQVCQAPADASGQRSTMPQ
jgi:hypothetical protein